MYSLQKGNQMRVRSFQESDTARIHEIYLQAMVYGRECFHALLFVLIMIARIMYVSSEFPSEYCTGKPGTQTSRHRLIRHIRRWSRPPTISSAGADLGRFPLNHNTGNVYCVETDHLV